eukprot:m51a1_g865 putative dna polymerase i (771) ;mRNA; f:814963-818028
MTLTEEQLARIERNRAEALRRRAASIARAQAQQAAVARAQAQQASVAKAQTQQTWETVWDAKDAYKRHQAPPAARCPLPAVPPRPDSRPLQACQSAAAGDAAWVPKARVDTGGPAPALPLPIVAVDDETSGARGRLEPSAAAATDGVSVEAEPGKEAPPGPAAPLDPGDDEGWSAPSAPSSWAPKRHAVSVPQSTPCAKKPKAAPACYVPPGHSLVAPESVAALLEGCSGVALALHLADGSTSFRCPDPYSPEACVGVSLLPVWERPRVPPKEAPSAPWYVPVPLGQLLPDGVAVTCYAAQHACRSLGSAMPNCACVRDAKVAAWVVDPDAPESSLGFSELVFSRLSVPDSRSLTPAEILSQDLAHLVQLMKKLDEELVEEDLESAFSFEMMVVPILARMEVLGAPVQPERLVAHREALEVRLEQLGREASSVAGMQVNLASAKQVAHILYDILKLPSTGKKPRSTSESALEQLSDRHPFVNFVLEHRKCSKILGTYVASLDNKAKKDADGSYKIHSQWLHTTTGTGRLSSANPNLQNLPRGAVTFPPFGSSDEAVVVCVRDAFHCAPGYIELRVLAHFSKDAVLIDTFTNGGDIHALLASKINRKPLESVTSEDRTRAKRVVFGVLYGMGASTLASMLKMRVNEASSFITSFFDSFPSVKVKAAMIRVHSKIEGTAAKMVMQIHDEVVLQVPAAEAESFAAVLRESMEEPLAGGTLDVPLRVNLRYGESLGALRSELNSESSSTEAAAEDLDVAALFYDDDTPMDESFD